MKQLFALSILLATLSATNVWADDGNTRVVSYKCTNNAGKVGNGMGRLSRDGEYSSFLKKTVQAGEFVIFRYDGRGKEYWFKAQNCTKS